MRAGGKDRGMVCRIAGNITGSIINSDVYSYEMENRLNVVTNLAVTAAIKIVERVDQLIQTPQEEDMGDPSKAKYMEERAQRIETEILTEWSLEVGGDIPEATNSTRSLIRSIAKVIARKTTVE